MIEIKNITEDTARGYLKKTKSFSELKTNNELILLKQELETTVLLKGQGISIKGPIFKKFVSEGTNHWLGAFDAEKLVGIHWHSFAFTGNDDFSKFNDIFDGQLYADNEDIARQLHKEFDRLTEGKYIVNYSFSFPGDNFDLEFKKSLGYTVWATIDWKAKGKKLRTPGTLHFLKRVNKQSEKNVVSKEELKKMKIADLKRQLEELNA